MSLLGRPTDLFAPIMDSASSSVRSSCFWSQRFPTSSFVHQYKSVTELIAFSISPTSSSGQSRPVFLRTSSLIRWRFSSSLKSAVIASYFVSYRTPYATTASVTLLSPSRSGVGLCPLWLLLDGLGRLSHL